MARLNITRTDGPSDENVIKELLVLAAKETIARGYAYFRFRDLSARPASLFRTDAAAKADFSVTIVMFHEGEQGLDPFFNAAQILKPDSAL